MSDPSLTIGIEEEYQLIDPDSRELLGYVTHAVGEEQMALHTRHPDFDFAQRINREALKIERPQNRPQSRNPHNKQYIGQCADIAEARVALKCMRTQMVTLGKEYGFKVAGAGTHPFSRWDEYAVDTKQTADRNIVTERMLAFGLQIHIGVEDRSLAIELMRTLRHFLPHFLALSASSPFWKGHDTGLKSYRSVVRDALPRTGIPGAFNSYQDYCDYVALLIRTHSVTDASQILYDITPHHHLPTLVVRICDMVPSFEDTLSIVALVQATTAWLVDLHQRNMAFRPYERTLVAENKWRAMRYGLSGELVDLGQERERPVRELLRELLVKLEPYVDRLKSRREIEHLDEMLHFSSADFQCYLWEKMKQNREVLVDSLTMEMEKVG